MKVRAGELAGHRAGGLGLYHLEGLFGQRRGEFVFGQQCQAPVEVLGQHGQREIAAGAGPGADRIEFCLIGHSVVLAGAVIEQARQYAVDAFLALGRLQVRLVADMAVDMHRMGGIGGHHDQPQAVVQRALLRGDPGRGRVDAGQRLGRPVG